jgi:hypothetical protein
MLPNSAAGWLQVSQKNSIVPYGVPQHTSDYLRDSSGDFAMFTAIRLASFFVSNFAAERLARHCRAFRTRMKKLECGRAP